MSSDLDYTASDYDPTDNLLAHNDDYLTTRHNIYINNMGYVYYRPFMLFNQDRLKTAIGATPYSQQCSIGGQLNNALLEYRFTVEECDGTYIAIAEDLIDGGMIGTIYEGAGNVGATTVVRGGTQFDTDLLISNGVKITIKAYGVGTAEGTTTSASIWCRRVNT